MKQLTTILMILVTFSIFSAGASVADTITVRADSWPPYNDEPDSAKPGYMIEIAKLIFEKHGHQIDYQLMPWTRSLEAVGKGDNDAIVGTDQDESPDFVFPEETFGIHQYGFYVKEGNSWKYDGMNSLASVKLGVIDGYYYSDELGEYIDKNKDNSKVFVATGDDALSKLLKMLKAGRVDAVIENVHVMSYVMKTDNLTGEFVRSTLYEKPSYLYMAFSPAKESSKNFAGLFDEGIAELRESGQLQAVLSRYGLNDWK